MFLHAYVRIRSDDRAVSPVVGTILMVAATVVLGTTIFAAVNAFGGESVAPPVNAVFKVQAIDTDGNGRTDAIKLTYVTGPSGVLLQDVKVHTTIADDPAVATDDPLRQHATAAQWAPGDSWIWSDNPATPADELPAGAYFFTVSILETTALDQSIRVDE